MNVMQFFSLAQHERMQVQGWKKFLYQTEKYFYYSFEVGQFMWKSIKLCNKISMFLGHIISCNLSSLSFCPVMDITTSGGMSPDAVAQHVVLMLETRQEESLLCPWHHRAALSLRCVI